MRSCAGAIMLLSLLRQAYPFPEEEYVSCKHYVKGGSEWTARVGDRYCYKRIVPKQEVTKTVAKEKCGEFGATLPQYYEGEHTTFEEYDLYRFALWKLCFGGKEDESIYWMGVEKRGDKWFWDDGRESTGPIENSKSEDAKYGVFKFQFDGHPFTRRTSEAKPADTLAHTCCQHYLNEPITKAPSTTVRTTQHYTQRRTQKVTPSKPIVYTRRSKPHQPPSTTTHNKPVTTKPGGNLKPKGTAGGMSTTLLLILLFLGGAMLVAALIVVGIYLAHSKKKKRRRHHHSRRHAEPPSTTARTNPSTSAF